MQETKGFLVRVTEGVPVGSRCLQKLKGADDVGLDELGRSINGAIDMGLGGKVHDGTRPVLREELGDKRGIPNVTSDKGVPRVPLKGGQILEISRVGELVEVDDAIGLARDPIEDEIRTDESGAASDEDRGHKEVEGRKVKS
jgi:hypothetical protein